MAIIYTYPQINSSSDLAASDLMIISDMSANGRPTKALKLSDLATFITNTGTDVVLGHLHNLEKHGKLIKKRKGKRYIWNIK